MIRFFKLLALLLVLPFSFVATAQGQTCAGFPAVSGFQSDLEKSCLGLVADTSDVPWTMPRQILFLDDSRVLISDLGGWGSASAGKVWQLNLATLQSQIVYQGGAYTHGLGKDATQRILVGDADRIVRIDGDEQRVMVRNLPTKGSHPLTHFIVLPNNDLVVNVGAPSDNCTEEMGNGVVCASRDREGEVRLYEYNRLDDSYNSEPVLLGRGLRNSMALLYNPILEVVYQAENNVDLAGTPEEFNAMPLARTNDQALDFGWPFCFGLNQQAPYLNASFANFCGSRAQAPEFLIPNHSSPLDMDYYFQGVFGRLENTLIMGWHGHRRQVENSIVAYALDSQFSPIVDSVEAMSYITVLSGLNTSSGEKIRPVGLATDSIGRIWFVDDKSKRLYVIAPSDQGQWQGDDSGQDFIAQNQTLVDSLSTSQKETFRQIYQDFLQVETCSQCHSQAEFPASAEEALLQFLNKRWVEPGLVARDMTLMSRMASQATPRSMPPQPAAPFEADHPEIYRNLEAWLEQNL